MIKPKLNHQIRSAEVRIVTGPETGVMSHSAAMTLASEHGFDLIEINPKAVPPVCIIAELGKWKYDQAKKEKATKQIVHETKTIQLRPVTEANDLAVKARQANEFLTEGHRVQVLMRFRGRELAHPEEGVATLERFVELCTAGQIDGKISELLGKQITCSLIPARK